jgi:hypothetical protein
MFRIEHKIGKIAESTFNRQDDPCCHHRAPMRRVTRSKTTIAADPPEQNHSLTQCVPAAIGKYVADSIQAGSVPRSVQPPQRRHQKTDP